MADQIEHPESAGARSKAKGSSSSLGQRSTGPRTLDGKRRSSRNALKHGLFSNVLLLDDESRPEYESLLSGLREDFQPRGRLETLLVETLATLFWRKRRLLQAEKAEITKIAEFVGVDELEQLRLEAYEHERIAESSGGILRQSDNPFLLDRAMQILTEVRVQLDALGFEDHDPWLLRKLYGLDENRGVPFGLFRTYLVLQGIALSHAKEKNAPEVIEYIKKQLLCLIDLEIQRCKKLKEDFLENEDRRGECKIAAAVVPPLEAADRLLRYETHLNREIDRTLNQLERRQRMRLGQLVLPSLKVELSR